MSNKNFLSIKEKVFKTEVYLDGQVIDTGERTEICIFVDGTEEVEIPLRHYCNFLDYQEALNFIENAEVIDHRLPPDVFSVGSEAWVYDSWEEQIIKVTIDDRYDRLTIQDNNVVRYTFIQYGGYAGYESTEDGVEDLLAKLKLKPEGFIRYE